MARLARVVIPGLPHHVTQRGNRREAIFFEDGDHGAPDFVDRLEKILGRPIARRAPGRKPTSEDHNQLRLL